MVFTRRAQLLRAALVLSNGWIMSKNAYILRFYSV